MVESWSQGFPQLDDHTAEFLLAEADADNDGSISFDELFAVIQEASRDGAKPEANAAGQTETELLQSRIAKLEAEVCNPHISSFDAQSDSAC